MVGKGEGEGQSAARLENQIAGIKYTIFAFNIVAWMIGAAMFGLSVWIRMEPGFEEWVQHLQLQAYYTGVYVLIVASVVVMIVSFMGCCAALMENTLAMMAFIATQVLCFLLGLAGAAVSLDYSTQDSSLQPLLRNVMYRLISTSNYAPSTNTLRMIQESIGCCGADGPNDYMTLRQPLPTECRDTVTGNAFFHGCIDELTWFVQDKTAWCASLAMALCMLHVVNAVLSVVLIQAIRKEEEEATAYKR